MVLQSLGSSEDEEDSETEFATSFVQCFGKYPFDIMDGTKLFSRIVVCCCHPPVVIKSDVCVYDVGKVIERIRNVSLNVI